MPEVSGNCNEGIAPVAGDEPTSTSLMQQPTSAVRRPWFGAPADDACYHLRVAISDTSPKAQAVQDEIHRSMPGEQKMALAYEMSMAARELNRSRLLREHPDWSEKQIARELLRLAFFPKPLPAGLP
ncbi:MAG TPA: hypothetical protein VND65_15365 [Candidatus Binatia bacterium]|nr:hypothetical protein [Candidatus Binatia bacterium]